MSNRRRTPIGTGTLDVTRGTNTQAATNLQPIQANVSLPSVIIVATDILTNEQTVQVTHPDPSAVITITTNPAQPTPNVVYTRGTNIKVPVNQTLRAKANVQGGDSNIVTYTNVLPLRTIPDLPVMSELLPEPPGPVITSSAPPLPLTDNTNANISAEQALQIARNVLGLDTLPSDKQANDLYWNTVLQQANITPQQYEDLKSKYVSRNSVGMLELVSASLENNVYVPLARVALSDTASFYQVLETDFTYFTDGIITDDLILPQNGTFFVRPNQADAHLDYGRDYVAYIVTNNKIHRIPNYQTLEVELVERKLTYDSVQILENPYVDGIINKFGVNNWSNRTNDWRPQFPAIAIYRPFPPPSYTLQASHDAVYEGQQVLVRLLLQRVPPGRRYNYEILNVDAKDIDIPLRGVLTTGGGEAQSGALLRINTLRDKRSDGPKNMAIAVDIPYDQTYGGGQRLEVSVDILERSTTPQSLISPASITRLTNTNAVELRSRNGQYKFVYQPDGKLVVYDSSDNAMKSYGEGSFYFRLQNDGALIAFFANNTVNFQLDTVGNGPVYMTMQDDGNLVIRRWFDQLPIWSTQSGRLPNALALREYTEALASVADTQSITNLRNSLRTVGVPAAAIEQQVQAEYQRRINSVRNIYNVLPQATKDALGRNTGLEKLAFINPTTVQANTASQAAAAAHAQRLGAYITGIENRIEAITYPGNRTFAQMKSFLETDSTEIQVADLPSAGRFGANDIQGIPIRGNDLAVNTTTTSNAGTGAASNIGTLGSGTSAGTGNSSPIFVPTGTNINLGNTQTATFTPTGGSSAGITLG